MPSLLGLPDVREDLLSLFLQKRRGYGVQDSFSPMLYALCSMLYALCPLPSALELLHFAVDRSHIDPQQ